MLALVGPALPLLSLAQLSPASFSRPSLAVRTILLCKVPFHVAYSFVWQDLHFSEPTNCLSLLVDTPLVQPASRAAKSTATTATPLIFPSTETCEETSRLGLKLPAAQLRCSAS